MCLAVLCCAFFARIHFGHPHHVVTEMMMMMTDVGDVFDLLALSLGFARSTELGSPEPRFGDLERPFLGAFGFGSIP